MHIYRENIYARYKCSESGLSPTLASPVLLQHVSIAIQSTLSAGAQGSCLILPSPLPAPSLILAHPASKLSPHLCILSGLWPVDLLLLNSSMF